MAKKSFPRLKFKILRLDCDRFKKKERVKDILSSIVFSLDIRKKVGENIKKGVVGKIRGTKKVVERGKGRTLRRK